MTRPADLGEVEGEHTTTRAQQVASGTADERQGRCAFERGE
jgi:hypothetical protein